MRQSRFFVLGILVMVLALGLVFAGCNTDGGDNGGEYPYAEYFPERVISSSGGVTIYDRPTIYIYFDKKIVDSYIWENDTAFSVTVGGVSESLGTHEIELTPPSYNRIGIFFDNDLPSSGDIKVSYDGTGVLTGKLEAFSNLAVSRK
jgi:hypothetical protein